jgi:GlpG protein
MVFQSDTLPGWLRDSKTWREDTMRQIATLEQGHEAHLIADYLRTLSIETKLEKGTAGWELWVCDEDQVPKAREELERFLANPSDPRYQAAARTARSLRAEKAREEQEYRKRQDRFNRRMAGQSGRPVTIFLIVTSVVVTLLFSSIQQQHLIYNYAFITKPHITPEGQVRDFGLQEIWGGQVWRLISPIFIHMGALHLLFNMLWLFDLGGQLERRYGSLRLLFLVVVIAVLSNLSQYYFGELTLNNGRLVVPQTSVLFGGMSGVVFGLFGYIWMKSRLDPESGLFLHPNNVILMLAWFVVCCTGLIGRVANMAHFMGLVVGTCLAQLSLLGRSRGEDEEPDES